MISKNSIFELYQIIVEVKEIKGKCTCNMKVGDKFYLNGGKVSLPKNQDFCLFALQSTIPLLPAKQRTHNNKFDWIETDNEVMCPDPSCKLIMEIKRGEIQEFNHNDVSSNQI